MDNKAVEQLRKERGSLRKKGGRAEERCRVYGKR